MENPKESAGILIYHVRNSQLEVFLVHPGGPFWKNKDDGVWSIPKGEIDDDETLLETALRELKEETGIVLQKEADFIELGNVTQKSGKVVYAWAVEGDWSGLLMCQSFASVEWPHKSGKFIKVPEVDKAGFFKVDVAKKKINEAQVELITRLEKVLVVKKQ